MGDWDVETQVLWCLNAAFVTIKNYTLWPFLIFWGEEKS
jgi:hypothetical protein